MGTSQTDVDINVISYINGACLLVVSNKMRLVPTIQFTQEQARAITGVSSQALRHWRKLVPYLAKKSGKAARFGFVDLVGIAAIQQIVDNIGVSVGSVQVGIESMLRILAVTRPSELQNTVLVIGVDRAELRRMDELAGLRQSAPVLLVPCNPLLEKMHGYVLPDLTIASTEPTFPTASGIEMKP